MLADIRSDTRSILQRLQAREERESFDEGALRQAVQAAIREELDARGGQGQGTIGDVIQAKVSNSSAAAAPAGGSGVGGEVMFRLGRIRFDLLEEDDDILGEGTFGVVQSGTYMGEEVAIKKARGLIGDPAVLREFRWVYVHTSMTWPVESLFAWKRVAYDASRNQFQTVTKKNNAQCPTCRYWEG